MKTTERRHHGVIEGTRLSNRSTKWKSLVSCLAVWALTSEKPAIGVDGYPLFQLPSLQHHRRRILPYCRRPRIFMSKNSDEDKSDNKGDASDKEMLQRVTRLEELVAEQILEIHRLKRQVRDLTETSQVFAGVINLLREAGLGSKSPEVASAFQDIDVADKSANSGDKDPENEPPKKEPRKIVQSLDEFAVVFGNAPSSVTEAADSAGSAILAAMLGGKQRMLVDVRDAELSSDPEILVQFIELAILPIAAGLEGLQSTRNRVKIVFPKVSQLLEYRRTMALAAPEVVALSTLGFDPIERRDKLVVIVAPHPGDEEGIEAIKELIAPSDPSKLPVQQPIVILNYHMLPVPDLGVEFETAYHLRLLNVQYVAAQDGHDIVSSFDKSRTEASPESGSSTSSTNEADAPSPESLDDEALEAAMKHAHEAGLAQGVTRAMVIRAYPRPWHVFVDVSPGTDADFEIAATWDEEPSSDDINIAIVECLEGSEREDELVAQQMQQALEDGQLDKVSEMIGDALESSDEADVSGENKDDQNEDTEIADDDEDDDLDYDMFDEETI